MQSLYKSALERAVELDARERQLRAQLANLKKDQRENWLALKTLDNWGPYIVRRPGYSASYSVVIKNPDKFSAYGKVIVEQLREVE